MPIIFLTEPPAWGIQSPQSRELEPAEEEEEEEEGEPLTFGKPVKVKGKQAK